jgi:glycopeptide antibiotics resistance protein
MDRRKSSFIINVARQVFILLLYLRILNYFGNLFSMNRVLKKIIILLPVLVIGLWWLKDFYSEYYERASFKRATGFIVLVLLIYGWFIIMTFRRRQNSLFEGFSLSAFYVYVFAVLTLTGYFILFKEISSHDWWDKMMLRVDKKDHVNLTLFNTMNIYPRFGKQIMGNFVMLLPLGIFLPLLYSRLRKVPAFFIVVFICFLTSAGIELLQLATSYRSADVDDLFLNTLGGAAGFIIFLLLKKVITKKG